MTFFRPEWLLLGALLPLIVLIYFKKKQVLEYRVSSLEFWEEIEREIQGVRVRRIDRYLPLILQLLAGLILVLAAAGPVWVRQFAGDRVVVAVDCSISMKAVEGGASRFDVAREEAGRIIRALPGESAVSLVLLSDGVRELATDATPKAAGEALEGAECVSRPLNADFAAGYLKGCASPVIVVTDKDLNLGDRVVRVGGALDNAGITGASYDYYSGSVFFTVKNYSQSRKRVTVSLWSGGQRIDAAAMEVQPGAWGDFSFAAPGADGLLTLKIEDPDMLEEDNVYFVPAGNMGKKKVLLAGGNYFLEKALASMADVSLARAGSPEEGEGCRAVIVAGGADAPALPEGAGVWYLAPGPGGTAGGGVKNAYLQAYDSPLTEGLAMKGVYLEEAARLATGEGMQWILGAGDAAVMAAGNENGRKTVYSSIDFNRTNLVLLPEFPVLVSNIVNWLAEDADAEYPGNPPARFVVGWADPGPGNNVRAVTPLFFPLGGIALAVVPLLLAAEWEVYRRGL
ncbi:MAG: BatA and WFA domain-containing protein [Peptococcaceae bacterium]|nr:BatA and WFA domain-containing protein [Peptococcaceae bacterium]